MKLTIALCALVASVLVACGGDSDEDAEETPTVIAEDTSLAVPSRATGEECTSDSPPNLGSTSHEVEVATSEQFIEMEWDLPPGLVGAWRYAFSQNPEEPPDEMERLDGDATSASSRPLGQNRWYFYLIAELDGGEEQPVRCGPYVITREGDEGADGGEGGSGDTVTLTIAASGGSSVEYFNNQGERLFCGDTSLSGHDVTCEAEFVRGSEARIQRTLGLSDEEEARWRLAEWGGACEEVDSDVEPRGGQCILIMDDDKDVDVFFEQRPMITITHTGPSQLLMRWGVDYRPAAQKGGGNPLTLRGEFDCDTDTLAACAKTAYYDAGTTVILRAGSGVDAPNLDSFSGACSTTVSTCEFVIEGDSDVTVTWKY
jgi:hypothetical protein